MYDVLIIGAGPAGLTAALYAARANMKVLVLEKGLYGGLMQSTDDIENYPSHASIKGMDLSQLMYDQILEFGAEYRYGEVLSVELEGDVKRVHTRTETIESHTVIIATGANPRKLGVDGEHLYSGRGVSYCAICDGAFFKEKHVVVVGGGDSAVEEAQFLTKFASQVTLIHRRNTLRAQPVLQTRLKENPKVNIIYDTTVRSIDGDGSRVTSVSLRNEITGQKNELQCDGAFIYVGLDPNTKVFEDSGILNDSGYIVTDETMATVLDGVYGVGDAREKFLRQIVTATNDGSIAAIKAQHHVEHLKDKG